MSWNISLALNFSEFLELSEGRVRFVLTSRPLYRLLRLLGVFYASQWLDLQVCFLLFCVPRTKSW